MKFSVQLRFIQFLFAFVFLVNILTIDAQIYNFKNYSLKDGLTQSEVYAIAEDNKGYIWFGTLGGGVVKFDGIHFYPYTIEDGLINNFVRSLFSDSKGVLWIGTEEGICIYNGRDFVIYDQEGGPGKTTVKCITEDSKGNMWIGTETMGLFSFDGSEFTNYSGYNGLLDNNVYCIFEDNRGIIWAGTSKGAFKIKKDHITLYTEESGLASDIVRSINQDDSGNIWFGTQDKGISVLNGNRFFEYTVEDGLSSNTVYHLYKDKSGTIWAGTSKGISRFSKNEFKTYDETNGIPANVVLCSFQDSFQNMWFGSSGGGASKFDGERFVHFRKNEFTGNRVFAITQVPGGNMLFGTSAGGITSYDGKNFSLIKGTENFTHSKVRAFYYTRDSSLWIGTLNDGAFLFDKNGFSKFSIDMGLCSNNITCFIEDTYGRVWVGSSDYGISIIYQGEIIRTIQKNDGLSSNTVYSFSIDNDDNIWVATENGGISIIENPKQLQNSLNISVLNSEKGIGDNTIRSIIKDIEGTIYLGTSSNGITIYDGEDFHHINKDDGLFSNNIYLLIFDDENNLWAGSENGLDKITLGKDFTVSKVKHYGYEDGFTGVELYKNASYKDSLGRLWFGTVKGITMYDPEKEYRESIQSRTYITGLKLFYDPIENTEFADSLSENYPLPDNLVLAFNKNSLTFSYIGIYHRNPKSVKYKVKLEGYEKDWSPVINQTEMTYSNLDPGKYTFLVKSSNEEGQWNENPATYSFTIQSPFWKLLWFQILFLTLLLVFIWAVVSRRIKQIRSKNKTIQERLELERNIIELEQKASRLQMNPHFIFNSLNSIQGFIAANDSFQAKKYLAKFARLMRLTLENSREEFIPLENELFVLENYLELEKLALNNSFDYTISYSDEINPEEIEIPPMLLQPFVENAILHGIKPLRRKGYIEVQFMIRDSFLVCEITDNGLGINQRQNKTEKGHKSSATDITKERLEKIRFENNLKGSIEFFDLKDEDKELNGTKVIVEIPVEL
jgi:ligand-binding sensor domain-containing protein